MNDDQILLVRSWLDREQFLTFPWSIYKNDPLWVPPMIHNLREQTDPKRGAFFKRGKAEFFLVKRGSKIVGTVCAGEDFEMNQLRGIKECIFGFLNLINDYSVMQILMNQVCQWAGSRGLNVISGPFSLDYEDSYGILIEGRDRPPTLLCGHTPLYYPAFFDRYGFEALRGDNIAYALDISSESGQLQQLSQMAERVRARDRFRVRPARMDRWEEELELITVLLNQSLAHLPDFRPWPREVVFQNLAPFRKFADPELILFVEENSRTVGWLPGLPNLNEVLIHANGLRYPWDYLSLAWHSRTRPECLTVKSVLMLPEYWGSGAAILLFDEMSKRARSRGYRWIDGSLTSDDNPRTPALAERLGAKIYKRFRVYTKRI
jgi:hypothetical protein